MKSNKGNASKTKEESIEDLESEHHSNKGRARRGMQKESTELLEPSPGDLDTVCNRNICQGVLEKFDYLQRKMKLENAESTEGKKGRKKKVVEKTCDNSDEVNDNVKKSTIEQKKDSVEEDEPSKKHKRSHTGERRTKNQCDTSKKGAKGKRTIWKKETEESLREVQAQVEQQRLSNKLKKAAGSNEIVPGDSKCDVQNKGCKKSKTLNGSVQQYDKSPSIRDSSNISKELDVNACPVTPIYSDNQLSKNSIISSRDKKDRSDENGKLDWRERLLFLEMSHHKFDVDINSAEDDTSEKSTRRRTRSGESNDLNEDKNEGRPKRLNCNLKNVKESKDICFSASTPLNHSKIKKRYSKKKTCKRKIRLAPGKSTPGKSKQKKSSDISVEDGQDTVSVASSLDLSLPTPRPPRVDSNYPFSFSLSFDETKMDDDCSSDEDLPVGLTPLKLEKTPSENDIVWVKWKKWPHLPALVRKVYKKKKRVTCAVFFPTGFEEDFTLSYGNQGAVIPYCDPKKDEILESAKDLSPVDRTFFWNCLAEAQNYMTKEALKGLRSPEALKDKREMRKINLSTRKVKLIHKIRNMIDLFKENITQEEEPEDIKNDNCEVENEEKITPCRKRRKMSDCIVTKVENNGLSKQGQERVEKRKLKTRPLIDFLISDTTKDFLEKIYNGTTKSELHDKFLTGTIRERAKMKHRGFGPIDDDEQIELLLSTYLTWIKQINKNIHLDDVNYVFDVWVPEAVVFAFKKMNGYSRKRAWERFDIGVRRTKEELQIMHNDLVK